MCVVGFDAQHNRGFASLEDFYFGAREMWLVLAACRHVCHV